MVITAGVPAVGGTAGAVEVTTIEMRIGAVTVKGVDPLIEPEVAVMVTIPGTVACATLGLELPVKVKVAAPPPESVAALQVTELVKFCVLLSV
jgi:hypothetical protein